MSSSEGKDRTTGNEVALAILHNVQRTHVDIVNLETRDGHSPAKAPSNLSLV